jgi:prevent-host-death family protein
MIHMAISIMGVCMKRTVSAGEARQRLGELLEGVSRGDEVVIERAGKPMAVVVPMERYAAMNRSRDRLFELIEQAQAHSGLSPEEGERLVEEEIAAVRKAARTRR